MATMLRGLMAILLTGVPGSRVLWANTIVSPGPAEGNANNVVPFGLGSPYFAPQITGRYQQAHGASAFLPFGVSTISELRPDWNWTE